MKLILAAILINITCINVYTQYTSVDAFPGLTFNTPTEIVSPNDATNRFFVLEKTGRIRVFPNNPPVSASKIFLTIDDTVSTTTYQGAFSFAFHPDYTSNRYFYVYYTKGTLPNLLYKVVRYTTSSVNPDSALPNSALTIITQPAPNSNHTGGSIEFGSDGYLYISWGDGSPGSGGDPNNNAQNKASLLGKILRIDVNSASGGNNYTIPATNPFFGNANGWREEIYAYGFRNVWKFSFDAPTGRLWAGDVGQVTREEIDIVTSGGNYGWRRKEGTLCYNPTTGCDTAGLIAPLYEYPHSSGVSITGGSVYRGTQMPGAVGKYIYSDWSNGTIWALSWDGVNSPANELLFDSPHSIVSFGTDQDKNLYYLHYSGAASKIYKIIDQSFTGTGNSGSEIPGAFKLEQNYPNPFNPVTSIKYNLPYDADLSIKIFDLQGKEVYNMVGFKKAGSYEVQFDGTNFASGMYFYSLTANDPSTGSGREFKETKKMVLIK